MGSGWWILSDCFQSFCCQMIVTVINGRQKCDSLSGLQGQSSHLKEAVLLQQSSDIILWHTSVELQEKKFPS